jgi:hypothetical protein
MVFLLKNGTPSGVPFFVGYEYTADHVHIL